MFIAILDFNNVFFGTQTVSALLPGQVEIPINHGLTEGNYQWNGSSFMPLANTQTFSYPPTSPSAQAQREAISLQFKILDPVDQMRAVREYLLADAVEKAAALGYTEAQLYAINIGYRKMKDRDNQLRALRVQLAGII